MSTKTSRKTVKTAGKGKAPKRPTVADVTSRIGDVVGKFGTPDALTKAATDALETATRSEEGHRAWVAVAVQSVESGQTAAAFATAAGVNGMTRTRLVRVAALLESARKARKSVGYWTAVAVANSGGKRYSDAMAAYAGGTDPFAGKVDDKGRAVKGAGKREASGERASRTKSVTVTPDQYPAVLALILANVDKISTDTARAEVRRLAGEVAAHPALAPKGKGKRTAA